MEGVQVNSDVITAWTEDLESGQHKQGNGCLARRNGDGTEKFCCLGRLEELALKAGIVTRQVGKDGLITYTDVEPSAEGMSYRCYADSILTIKTAEWAGIDINPVTIDGEGLADLNDRGVSFPEISAKIKKGLS